MLMRTQTSKLLQFSMPSSPISPTPKAINLRQFRSSDPVQSPQLARMIMNNNKSSPKTCVPQSRLPYFVPVTSPMAKEEGKSYDEIAKEISEFFMKFPVHPNDQMDRVNVATTSQNKLKVGSSASTTSRGHQRPLDGITTKLERFKIRTVQPGEVVKVEEERKS